MSGLETLDLLEKKSMLRNIYPKYFVCYAPGKHEAVQFYLSGVRVWLFRLPNGGNASGYSDKQGCWLK